MGRRESPHLFPRERERARVLRCLEQRVERASHCSITQLQHVRVYNEIDGPFEAKLDYHAMRVTLCASATCC